MQRYEVLVQQQAVAPAVQQLLLRQGQLLVFTVFTCACWCCQAKRWSVSDRLVPIDAGLEWSSLEKACLKALAEGLLQDTSAGGQYPGSCTSL